MKTVVSGINVLNPSVSVVITVFNRRKKLMRALDSVIAQTYTNYEIIIIDDGSEDKPENLLFPVLKKYAFIKYLRHSNRLPVRSLNTGLRLTSGRFITFLDSDDEYKPDHLNLRINFMQRNKSVDLIHSPAVLVGNEKDFYVPDARNRKKLIHLDKCVIGATFFGKSKVFKTLEGFKNVYSYDSEFFKRASALFNVRKFDCLSYIYYRDSKDSILTLLKNILH